MINAELLALYHPHKEVSFDEAMIPFKGCSSMKQYMPKKPVKRVFKVWTRADAVNVYISEFYVYTGKEGGTIEVNLGAKVVTSLLKQLTGLHQHVYFDNYFTSISLLLNLLKTYIFGCGTMRTNRKRSPNDLPAIAKKKDSQKGGNPRHGSMKI